MGEPTLTLAGLPVAWRNCAGGRTWVAPEPMISDAERKCAADLEAVLAVLRVHVNRWRRAIDSGNEPTEADMVKFWERRLGMEGGQ